jgi:hypothetical protein
MNWTVVVDGKFTYLIEAETKDDAQALAVRYFARDNGGPGGPDKGRVTSCEVVA